MFRPNMFILRLDEEEKRQIYTQLCWDCYPNALRVLFYKTYLHRGSIFCNLLFFLKVIHHCSVYNFYILTFIYVYI